MATLILSFFLLNGQACWKDVISQFNAGKSHAETSNRAEPEAHGRSLKNESVPKLPPHVVSEVDPATIKMPPAHAVAVVDGNSVHEPSVVSTTQSKQTKAHTTDQKHEQWVTREVRLLWYF